MNIIKEFFGRLGLLNQSVPIGYNCAICFDTANDGTGDADLILQHLDCGHHFHKNCIDRWIKCKNICPMCRRQAFANEEEDEEEEEEEEVDNTDLTTIRRDPLARPPLSTYVDRMAEQTSLRLTMNDL